MAHKIYYNDSIFWVEVEKINPNPYQPRKDFDESKLRDLAGSVRQYGVLQPLVVTRKEVEKEDGGLATEYELIAGERRLRAAKMAGLGQVPAVIREGDPEEINNRLKLELAIIENIQREDLNPIERARAFKQLVDEFKFKHTDIAKKIGKSREYVTNSIRLLSLPEPVVQAISEGKITEGHARPLMMLVDRSAEQEVLFKEILQKRLTVREAEKIARHTAVDRVRNKAGVDPEMIELERKLTDNLGTRVHIERRENGGKLTIDFFTVDDVRDLLTRLEGNSAAMREDTESPAGGESETNTPEPGKESGKADVEEGDLSQTASQPQSEPEPAKKSSKEDENLYSVKNFSL